MRMSALDAHQGRDGRAAGLSARRPPVPPSAESGVLPALPAEVAELLESGIRERRYLFPDNGGVRIVETWEPPAALEDGLAGTAATYLSALEAALRPAERGVLLARILALLSHFRAEPNPPQVEQMIADDWAEDLGEFPIWAVEQACRQWRRTRKWRPQICEMVALCQDAVAEPELRRRRLRALLQEAQAKHDPRLRRMRELTRGTFQRVPV